MLAAAWLCVLIESAMKDQERQCNKGKLLFESLVGPNHRGHSLRWLSFMGNEWVVVHGLDNFGVARKSLVGEVKHMCVWRDMTQPFENCQGKIGRRQFVRETFADQPRQLSLMVESVEARDDAACAVTEHKNG